MKSSVNGIGKVLEHPDAINKMRYQPRSRAKWYRCSAKKFSEKELQIAVRQIYTVKFVE